MKRVVLSFTVAMLLSSSTLMLRAQTKAAVSPANSASVPEDVKTATEQRAAAADEFVIGPGDILAINVWKEAEISKVVPVRSDGRISLPLIGELQSGGLTPRQLEAEITKGLKDYVAEPFVTVVVQEIHSQNVNVLGMVNRPGSYPLTKTMTVVDAIATAGGFRDFAKQKSIYILRQNPDGMQTRLAFNYKEVIKGVNPTQNVKVEPGDTIVVP